MTTLNTLFLPLLGGFLFFYISHWTAYFAANQPTQAVLFFSAFTGLWLLILARLVTYYCEVVPYEHDDALRIGILLLPPLLFSKMLGWGVALLQSSLEGTRIRRLKAVLSLLSTVLAVVVFVRLEAAESFFPRFWGVPYGAYWAGTVVLLFSAALPWSRLSSMPLSVVLVRAAVLGIAVLLVLHWLLPRLPDVLGLWTGVTKPLGDNKVVAGIGTAFLACLLGPFLATCFNVLYSKDGAAARLVRKGWASGFDQLIYRAARRERPVMLTLEDHKVYVGLVEAVFTNQRAPRDSYLKILPLMSGYRDAVTHQVQVTTYYRPVYRSLSREHGRLSPNLRIQFEKIVPVGRVVSAGLFEARYFRSFKRQSGSKSHGAAGDEGAPKSIRLRGTVRLGGKRSFGRSQGSELTVDLTADPKQPAGE